eukprot:scaffold2741_cov424-Pavlova_lutheri.AAC.1
MDRTCMRFFLFAASSSTSTSGTSLSVPSRILLAWITCTWCMRPTLTCAGLFFLSYNVFFTPGNSKQTWQVFENAEWSRLPAFLARSFVTESIGSGLEVRFSQLSSGCFSHIAVVVHTGKLSVGSSKPDRMVAQLVNGVRFDGEVDVRPIQCTHGRSDRSDRNFKCLRTEEQL